MSRRDGKREEIFDEFVIEERLRPAFQQAAAQAGAVAGGIVGRSDHRDGVAWDRRVGIRDLPCGKSTRAACFEWNRSSSGG
ncbi:hypothetical protein FHS99_000915 [Sphingomonas prati]|uniref:Uncharacterized protein n=1 Tax=Sphingomonas prati TaxID=1843237 RepID=A0A7W9BQX1_9SPHN|nr:hypothetical protein [Sphingomonas prati]